MIRKNPGAEFRDFFCLIAYDLVLITADGSAMNSADQPTINPYAPPEAQIDTQYLHDEVLVLADRGTRLGAHILDYAWIVVLGILMALLVPVFGKDASEDIVPGVLTTILAAAGLAVVIWNMILIHRYGQTMGKRWLNIKVVRCSGERCSLRRYVFLRWLPLAILVNIPLLGAIIGLGNPLMIFREDRRCGHDFLADTIVVNV